ncbi:MAG: flagellin [Pseudomonadota bacterium]
MNIISTGDLAQTFSLSRQNNAVRQELDRLTQELTSGLVQDVTDQLSGRFSGLAGFEREISLLNTYSRTVSEAQTQATVMQVALDQVQTQFGDLVNTLALSFTAAGLNDQENVALEARASLNSVLSSLNTTVAGRALFSGTDVATLPLETEETVLTNVRAAISGLTTAADVTAAADAYFGPGGGFETDIYRGATTDLAEFDLGAGESVNFALRADNQAIRDVLKTTALAALITDPGLVLSEGETERLLQSLTETTLSDREGITRLQASLGFAEGRIEAATTRIETETSSMEIARAQLIEADPFETATELEAVQIRLEMLYTLTARSSRLSLVNFL